MHFEDLLKKISPTLKRITYKLNRHYFFLSDEDLYQEALLHLWQDFQKGTLSDKTDSYILQGCYFHLKNYIRVHKDKASLVALEYLHQDDDGGSKMQELFCLQYPEPTRARIHCDFLVEQIRNNGLTQREKEIFNLALEGLTTREIGKRLGMSHVRVVKLEKRIRTKCLRHMDVL